MPTPGFGIGKGAFDRAKLEQQVGLLRPIDELEAQQPMQRPKGLRPTPPQPNFGPGPGPNLYAAYAGWHHSGMLPPQQPVNHPGSLRLQFAGQQQPPAPQQPFISGQLGREPTRNWG